ncbi:ATP-dependent DNA helicase PIF1-like [Dendronephthya gigantea]|uniref:ATP-dependent DNA helicase PIF1-like n=1 Tax=Dendronephthya gigantea TaxID=151771 RepID=UPI00106CC7AB|nr:ATP-dependent DNA helicase PIF1-like [Dendronephthya gigantea]
MAYSRLTGEQLNIVNFAKSGHNLCIFGQAGVGKSTVVQEIRRSMQEEGKWCQIVCASGIACGAYDGYAKTVHSHYGLQIAELPQNLLLERSLERANIIEQIKKVDVLIWDEVSMSSLRLFNLVNLLHQETSESSFPFGGIQVILVGDFWQLKPIQSGLDNGDPVYESKLFGEVFSHRFELTKVLRQNLSEVRLKEALNVIRYGNCDDDTERYLCSLSRDFPPSLNVAPASSSTHSSSPVHIFFKRLPADVHNAAMLASLPGPKLTFKSSDVGCANLLDRTISQVLHFKPGCRVMLVYNINQHLKNGICGTFVEVGESGEELLVDFSGVAYSGKFGISMISQEQYKPVVHSSL